MKYFKKYIPIALLVANLGLGFNIGCTQKQEAKEESRIMESKPDECHIVEDKGYLFDNVIYVEYDNKRFQISSKVKVLDSNKNLIKEFYATYYCGTDVEGEFCKDALSLCEGLNYNDKMVIHALRDDTSSEYRVDLVVIFKDGKIIDFIENIDTRREEFFKFGKEKLQLYNKLFNIEGKKKQAKGKNLCHLLNKFDITELILEDFSYDPNQCEIIAKKEKLEVSMNPDSNYSHISIRYDISDKTLYSPNHIWMTIMDSDNDGKTDTVCLENTEFEREKDGTFKYIKDLYTEEQVKGILRNADQKLELANKVKKQIKIPEKKSYSKKVLERFE